MSYTMDLFEQHGLNRKQFLLPAPEESLNGYECLSSYIQRIANNHNISVVTLLESWSDERSSSMCRTFASYMYGGGKQSYRINGRTEITSWLAETVVKQDLLIKVNQMTIPINRHYNAIQLRKHLAWCPSCLSEQITTKKVIYYPLLWMPKNNTYCHQHNTPLLEQCSKCSSYQPVMAFHNKPGNCSTCFSFLGGSEGNYPYGFQAELWPEELNCALISCVKRKRYANRLRVGN